MFAQAGCAIVVVRVQEGTGATAADRLAATLPYVIGGTANGDYTGMWALVGAKSAVGVQPRVLCAPGFTSVRPLSGVTNIAISNGGSGYTSAPSVTFTGGNGTGAAATASIGYSGVTGVAVGAGGSDYASAPTVAFSGGGGTGAAATAVVSGGAVTAINVTNAGTGYHSAPTVTLTGGGGTSAAATASVGANAGKVTNITVTNAGTGFTSAPTVGFTGGAGAGAAATAQVGKLANPVAAAFAGVADRLRAVAIIDGPNTTDAEAIDYREDHGSKRLYIVDPWVKAAVGDIINGPIIDFAASAAVCGLIAKSDNDRGFWWSPSNQTMNAVVGTARPIDFTLGDINSRANILNENEVATIIREDGFRLWGNRTCANDPKWAFLSVVRTADIINDSLQAAHLWAVDRCINRAYVSAVIQSVNAYLRQLRAMGAILGGKCWADPALNTPESISDGRIYFDFDFTPPFPAERVTFRSHLVNDYVTEILTAPNT